MTARLKPRKADPRPSSKDSRVHRAAKARRHSRSELLEVVAAMARELERRGATPLATQPVSVAQYGHGPSPEVLGCLRAAQHLREVLSIAEGRKSAAYWWRMSRPGEEPQRAGTRANVSKPMTLLPLQRALGVLVPRST